MNFLRTTECQFGDEKYVLSSLTIGDLAAFRDFVRNRRLNAIRTALEGHPDKNETLRKAVSASVTDEEANEALKELDSIIFLLHRSLSKNHPGITLEKAGDLIPISQMGELSGILAAMMGGGTESQNPTMPPKSL